MFGCAGHPALLISSSSVVVLRDEFGSLACMLAAGGSRSITLPLVLHFLHLMTLQRGIERGAEWFTYYCGDDEFEVYIVIAQHESCSHRL